MSGTTSSSTTPQSSYAQITITPSPGFTFVFDGMKMIDELGRPFEIDLDVTTDAPHGDLMTLLGGTATIVFQQPGRPTVPFNTRIARVRYTGLTGGAYRYRLLLRPWVWLLSRTQDCKIFQKMSPFDIISLVFKDAGFSDVKDKRSLSNGSTPLDFCVQYRETSLDFVTRLMEMYGIYYYFEHSTSAHTLVFADDLSSHVAIKTPVIPYQQQMTEARTTKDHVWDFNADMQLQSGSCTFLDYNFTTPSADLTVKSMDSDGEAELKSEIYDYPGFYDTVANGKKLIEVRMEDLTARRHTLGGTTNSRAIQVGVKFQLSQHPDSSMNQEYVVTGTTTTFGAGESRSTKGGDLVDTYRCSFHAIPSKVPFRLDQKTPRPMIRGPQTARVVGASGDEITTDEYGRIKLKFPWDRSDAQDDTASCWIRVSQSSAGAGFGAMIIPRVGEEVIVEFLEGSPDRPIVTGRVYNATVKVPYSLPAEKTKSTLKTNSSKGGGGFNEIRMEDSKDSEEIFVNAQKDYNEVVLNNKTIKITKAYTKTVDQGDHTTTISQGGHSTTVSAKDHELTVTAGNHKITISAGKSDITAGTSITLTVGGSSIKVAPDGITLSAPKISVTGNAQVEVSAPAVTVSGSATTEISGGMVKIN